MRTGGWRFSPATMSMKIEPKAVPIAGHFPTYYLHVPKNLRTKWQTCYNMVLLFSYIAWKFLDHYCQAVCLKCVNYWRLHKKGPSKQLSLHTNHLWPSMSQAATRNQSQRGLFVVDLIWKKAFPVDSGNTTKNLNSCQGAVWKSWHARKVFILGWHRNLAERSLV